MNKRLRIGVLTDVHLAPAGSPPKGFINSYPFEQSEEMLSDALAWLGERDVDAVAVLGDLVMFEDEASLDVGMSRIASLGKPVLIVPGNHDGVDWSAAIARNFPNQELPIWPAVSRLTDVKVEQNPERWWTGGLSAPDDEPVLVLSHFPVINVGEYLSDAGFPYAGDATWDDSRKGLSERTSPVVVFSGHVHVRYEITDGSVLQLGFGALIEPPHGAAVLNITEVDGHVDVTVEHIDVAEYEVDVIPVISPAKSTWRYRTGAWSRQ